MLRRKIKRNTLLTFTLHMDKNFQDRIDEYLLHADRMTEEDKQQFLSELEQDKEKHDQFEFTRQMQQALCSRENKLKELHAMNRRYKGEQLAMQRKASVSQTSQASVSQNSRKRIILGLSGIAAAVLLGFFIVYPSLTGTFEESPTRGGNDVFAPIDSNQIHKATEDSTNIQPIKNDTLQSNSH